MKAQKVSITLGKFRLTLALGDANGNGDVDVSFVLRVVDMFEFPPFVVDLNATNAQKAVDAFRDLGDLLLKKK